MKIVVGIPSYMEANNISFVTEQVDQGIALLKENFPEITDGIIYNMDNNSSDKTSSVFINTKTQFSKKVIKTYGPPGKGKNIYALFEEVAREKYDYIVTVDADLKTIEPGWILDFVTPLINDKADYVSPIYQRSRFEGSTTNHFAYPLIFSYFGKDIRQPIAGDFAFSLKFIKNFLDLKKSQEADRYGIDIMETITAVSKELKTAQIKLAQKIHNPSFNKMRLMFPEIAASAMEIIKFNNLKLNFQQEKQDDSICINDDNDFLHKEAGNKMLIEAKEEINSISGLDWLDNMKKIKKNLLAERLVFSKELWANILSDWMIFNLKNEQLKIRDLADQLLPFFTIKAVSFWNWSEQVEVIEIEKEIREQAFLLRDIIKRKIK